MRILAPLGYLLGNAVYSRILEDIFEGEAIEASVLRMGEAEYDSPAPAWARIGETPLCVYQHRRLYRQSGLDASDFDALVFQTYHASVPYGEVLGERPGILALDSTPRLDWRRNRLSGGGIKNRLRWRGGQILADQLVRASFRNMYHFFAWSETVKRSLVNDYGVPSERIDVTYVPVPVRPGSTERAPGPPRLLFVGNDFRRKGGPLLVRVFDEHFADRAELTVVSRDAAAYVDFSRTSATHLAGLTREEVIDRMQASDLFLFPSSSDALGIVLLEAVKCGLPVIACTSGSQGEIVQDGVNGVLLAHDADESRWVEALDRLLSDPELLGRMGRESLRIAERIWDRDRLSARLLSLLRSATA